MRSVLIMFVLLFMVAEITSQSTKQFLQFEHEGITLYGVLNLPERGTPKGVVLILHGDGKTEAVAGEWYYDVRHAIINAGYATFMWDKPGCGRSGGTYQNARPIRDEAKEVMAAILHLRTTGVEGLQKIGLWGISRAGWIAPVVIEDSEDIAFWISVSGVDDDETFKYLLKENLRIEGYPPDTINLIVQEWHNGILLSRGGASYAYYQRATRNFRQNEFCRRISNGGVTEADYYRYQKIFQSTPLDQVSELPLYVENFESFLTTIDVPILALFGEKDTAVNWKQTKALYERILAPNTSLTVRTFPNCNHNMWQCITGGIYEHQDTELEYVRCEGFLESITNWLLDLE